MTVSGDPELKPGVFPNTWESGGVQLWPLLDPRLSLGAQGCVLRKPRPPRKAELSLWMGTTPGQEGLAGQTCPCALCCEGP